MHQHHHPPRRPLAPRPANRRYAGLRALALALLTFSAAPAAAQLSPQAPEADTGRQDQPLAHATRHMVVAANPHAAAAGRAILRAGGSAADAAIAVQAVLGLVEPQSSGLGGGAFALHWEAARRTLTAFDARERAPRAATPDRFPPQRTFAEHVVSGLSIGVPGVPRLLDTLRARFGRLAMADLLAPAIRLARDGFAVSPRLHLLLRGLPAATFSQAARTYFYQPDGTPWPIGHILKNPDYATTLEAIARTGADAVYRGAIAEKILAATRATPLSPSDMTAADLADYAVIERPPFCTLYRAHTICGMGPPSSGGTTVAQTLALIETFDLGTTPDAAMAPQALHLIAEAEKLAYADRNRYLGDPDVVRIPLAGFLDRDYIATRRGLIDPARAMPPPRAGTPPGADRRAMGEDHTLENVGTSHISIVDDAGNAIAMTTSIEAAFGARTMAAGFLLNNELTDFSLRPRDAKGRLAANAPGPGKRPRSSMAPTIVFAPGGKPWALIGSPGGSRIILYVVKALVALIDWRLDPAATAALPNFGSRGAAFEIEPGHGVPTIAHELSGRGHQILSQAMTSGLNIIRIHNGILEGGSDPRREGIALGD